MIERLATLLLTAAMAGQDSPNDPEWRQLLDAATLRAADQEYVEAKNQLIEARTLADRFRENDPRRGYTAMKLADVHFLLNELVEARRQYEQAVPIFREMRDDGFLHLAYCTHQLAEIDLREGVWADAETRFKRAIHMFEQLGPEHERALTGSLFGLARLYRTLVEYRKAEPVMKEVMRRVESSKIKPDDYGLMIAELGEIAWNEGNLPKADQFYQQAIKESVDRHGSVHREVAYLLDRHAELLERMSQSKRANGLRKEAQVIREKTL